MDVTAVSSASRYDAYAAAAAPRSAAGGTAPGSAADASQESGSAAPASADHAKSAAKPGQSSTAGQNGSAKKSGELTKAQQEQVRQLQKRDQDVRQHEMAHLAASGGLAVSGPTYTFQTGPDGIAYAVGGEVNISMSPGRTPQETIARAETVIAAALAPADPSGQDRAVAAQARQMAQQATAQAMSQQMQKTAHAGAQKPHAGIGLYQQTAGAGASGASVRTIDTTA
mgnify:FL=1